MSTEEAKGMGESKSAAPPALDSPEPAAQTASGGESGMTSAEQTHVFADLVRKLNALEKLNLDLKRDVRAHRRVCGAGWLATCVSVAGRRLTACCAGRRYHVAEDRYVRSAVCRKVVRFASTLRPLMPLANCRGWGRHSALCVCASACAIIP